MNEFFRTRMGQTFFEGTMPNLVEQLKRLNNLLERALTIAEKLLEAQTKTEPKP
jgi:hypothetical protein